MSTSVQQRGAISESDFFRYTGELSNGIHRGLNHLLALPYHLRHMREKDDLTHLVVTLTGGTSYAFVLRELDRLMYPGMPRLKFLFYDPRTDPKMGQIRNGSLDGDRNVVFLAHAERLENYFSKRKKVRVAVFDETN